jgi:hypothetical protein
MSRKGGVENIKAEKNRVRFDLWLARIAQVCFFFSMFFFFSGSALDM